MAIPEPDPVKVADLRVFGGPVERTSTGCSSPTSRSGQWPRPSSHKLGSDERRNQFRRLALRRRV